MPASTRPGVGLTVVFYRNGEPLQSFLAPNGERALRGVLLMLAMFDKLQAGDRVEVSKAD
jgi:hypothetical protein